MRLLDRLRDKVVQNSEKIERGIEKGARVVDDKTGHKYSDKIGKGRERMRGRLRAEERNKHRREK